VCTKFLKSLQSECAAPAASLSDELDCQCSSAAPEIHTSTLGKSENWMVLSIAGDKPTARFNVKCY
jgi:hypothetical protein